MTAPGFAAGGALSGERGFDSCIDWFGCFIYATPRDVLIWLGTRVMRDKVLPDVWAQALVERITTHMKEESAAGRHARVVVTDLRFHNEVNSKMMRRFTRVLGHHSPVGVHRWCVVDTARDHTDATWTDADTEALHPTERGAVSIPFEQIIKNDKGGAATMATLTGETDLRIRMGRLHGAVHDIMRSTFGLQPSFPAESASAATLAAMHTIDGSEPDGLDD